MTGKMDWTRAGRRKVHQRPQDQPTRPQPSTTGAWRDILDAMAPTPGNAKAKRRKPRR